MPDFTQSPWPTILGFATLAALLLTAVVPVLQWWLGRRFKELSYRVVSAEPLVSIREADELQGRLVVTFDGQPAQGANISAVVVRVWNSGNEPINDMDFKAPIFLTYGTGATVLTERVPLGPAEMAHCGRTIIGQDDYFGPTKPSVWHGNRRVAMFWVGSGVPTEGFSSISAGPNGTP